MSDTPPVPPPPPGYGPPQGYPAAPAAAPVPPPPMGAAPAAAGPLSPMWMMTDPPPPGWQPKQKLAAALLGILLGGFGAHSFYLGNSKKGIIQLVVSVFTCGFGGLWGLIEGIQILAGSNATDAYGIALTE